MVSRVSHRIVIHFPQTMVDQPIVYKLVKDYNLIFNILKASVTPEEEGLMVLEISGREEDYRKGIEYLKKAGLKIEPLSKDIIRDEQRCTHCGACITICPTGALVMDRNTFRVHFRTDKCIACELCIKTCPPRAMEVHF